MERQAMLANDKDKPQKDEEDEGKEKKEPKK